MKLRIELSRKLQKQFRKRVSSNPALEKRTAERIDMFLEDRTNPVLRDHRLVGSKQSFRAFSVTGDIRIIYIEVEPGVFLFDDIGTHSQVY